MTVEKIKFQKGVFRTFVNGNKIWIYDGKELSNRLNLSYNKNKPFTVENKKGLFEFKSLEDCVKFIKC